MLIKVVDGLAFGTRGDTLIAVYRDAARARPLTALYVAASALCDENPDGVLALQFVLGTSRPPDAEARAINSRELTRLRPHLRRLVTVALGDDLWIMIVRATLRAMSAISGARDLHVVESTLAGGFRRIREKASPSTPDDATLRDSTSALFERLGVASPSEIARL